MILLRALVRLLSFLLLVVLALAGLGAAVSSLRSGSGTLSLPWLARQVHLPQLRDQVSLFLMGLETPGPSDLVALLAGVGAVVVGIALLAGLFVPRRERLVTLVRGSDGNLGARRRPLAQVAGALVEQVRGVTQAKAKVKPRRRAGGRIRLTAERSRTSDPKSIESGADEALAGLTSAFALRARVRSRLGDSGSRVQ